MRYLRKFWRPGLLLENDLLQHKAEPSVVDVFAASWALDSANRKKEGRYMWTLARSEEALHMGNPVGWRKTTDF